MDLQALAVAQLDDVIREYESRPEGQPLSADLIVRLIAAVERFAPRDSAYVRSARQFEGAKPALSGSQALQTARALRADYAAGYVRTVEELIHSEVFADFLEMAHELLTKGYKDPAAVIAGSVLEEHLRKLAAKSDIAIQKADGSPKKADTLNGELGGVPVYNKLEQKSVTAWLDLRNKAAHGQYGEYDAGQVEALIRDVRGFLVRHAA